MQSDHESGKSLRRSLGEGAIDPEGVAIEPVERELLELARECSGIAAAHRDREAALAVMGIRRFAIGRDECQISGSQEQARANVSRQIRPERSLRAVGIAWRDDGEARSESELCQKLRELMAHGQPQIDLDPVFPADQQSRAGVTCPQGVIRQCAKA